MAWVATAIVGATVVGAGASMIAADKQSSAISGAAATSSQASADATAQQLSYLREVRADIADAVDQGLIDLDTGFNMALQSLNQVPTNNYNMSQQYIDQARNLIENPDQIMENPALQYQYNRGIDALQAGFSRTSGGGLTGNMIEAAQEYGQNFAAQALDTELNRLMTMANSQFRVEDMITSREAEKFTNIANLWSGLGTTKASTRIAGATQTGNVTNAMGNAVSNNILTQGDIAANAGINQANVSSNMLSNVAGSVSDMSLLFAMKPDLFKG